MTYQQAIRYLESFINYEKIPAYPYKKSLKLERIKGFLEAIGSPQRSLKCIHVAGSKGKGSTCAFVAYILRRAGYKTGLYTSPHLVDFRERIRILSSRPSALSPLRGGSASLRTRQQKDFEGMISKEELTRLVTRFRPEVKRYNKDSVYGPLTFFEVCTALAFVYFKEQGVDFAVLETGLGGRLDATNTVNSLVSVITPISYEHTDKLGDTLAEIAGEKAGIIKDNHRLTIISAPQEKEALEVIRKRCKETSARLITVENPARHKIRLLGGHQRINAAVAAAAVKALEPYNIKVSVNDIKKGLYDTLWPCRCEVIADNPAIVLDGAQNSASARALRETIENNFKYKKLILVFGVSSDKDIRGIRGQLYGLADKVVLTAADNPRAKSPESLVRYFKGRDVYTASGVKEARNKARKLAGPEDLILVTGSLFVAGEFRNAKN